MKQLSAWLQVGLDVRGKHDLEESLDFYVQSELMEGENQYLCEEAGKKVSTTTLHLIRTCLNACCMCVCIDDLLAWQGLLATSFALASLSCAVDGHSG